jgi:succinate dehydrogenase / fumarate reductase cytochrome b subunit
MRWGGVIILLFVIYHLMHFTFGTAHPDFVPGDVYHNFVAGFRVPLASGCYVAAMLALGLHLYHGVWSMLRTLGLSHPRYVRASKAAALAFAAVITVGNVSFPVAVLAGVVR